MKKTQTVWVKNNGVEPFFNRYDGEDFKIEPGAAVEMTVECAMLVFGFGQEDKSRCLRRLGWTFTADAMSAGAKRLDEFSFNMSEREASEHDPSSPQTGHSSVPVGGDALSDASLRAAEGVVTPAVSAKPAKPINGPLAKLAQANAAAG